MSAGQEQTSISESATSALPSTADPRNALPSTEMGAVGLANARIGMHTLLMTSGTQTTVIFSCPKCCLFYEATQEQHPDIRAGSFKCKECNAEVHTWSGVYNFFGWKAKVMRPMQPGTKII